MQKPNLGKNYDHALGVIYDIFKDCSKAESQLKKIAEQIHYPECWDVAAYPTVADAVIESMSCNPADCQKPKPKKMPAPIVGGIKAMWEPTIKISEGSGPHEVEITSNDHGRVYCDLNGKNYGDYEMAFTAIEAT